jgi:hypothetical protein
MLKHVLKVNIVHPFHECPLELLALCGFDAIW